MARFASVVALAFGVGACAEIADDPRQAQITSVLAAADLSIIRTRPALAAGKYARMAASPVDWFRGSLAVYRSDARTGATRISVSRFGMDAPLVPSHGDPHPENFGVVRASDGSLALEPNDFDSADRAPYLWDVRRMASGMALGVALSNADAPAARKTALAARPAIVREAIAGYVEGIADALEGKRERITPGAGGAIVADVFARAERDFSARAELDELTTTASGQRRLRRGAIDEGDPQKVFAELLPSMVTALPDALERYRQSLAVPLSSGFFTLLDAVRSFGSGVGSWPRVRAILLVRGPSDDDDDDVLLELKELGDSTVAAAIPPGVFHDDVGKRVLASSRAAWARPDAEAFWGVTTWLGLPCQIRLEAEGLKGISIDRFAKDLGTPAEMSALARALGKLVARIHTSGDGRAVAEAIQDRIAIDPEGFITEQVDAGIAYADLSIEDHARFVRALYDSGLRLGVPLDSADLPRGDFAALLGFPPAPPSLPARP